MQLLLADFGVPCSLLNRVFDISVIDSKWNFIGLPLELSTWCALIKSVSWVLVLVADVPEPVLPLRVSSGGLGTWPVSLPPGLLLFTPMLLINDRSPWRYPNSPMHEFLIIKVWIDLILFQSKPLFPRNTTWVNLIKLWRQRYLLIVSSNRLINSP